MRKLLFILPVILLMACKKEAETTEPERGSEYEIYLSFKNNAGQNLLNAEAAHRLTTADIDVLDLSSQGHKIYFQNSKNVNAVPILVHKTHGKVIKLPFQNGIKIGNKMTKFLQYSDYSEDKITIEEGYDNGTIFIHKIWLNDVLVAINDGSNRFEPILILK